MSNKLALITGANRGLGRSMALHLAKHDVAVIGTYRNHKDEADSLVAEIVSAGGKAAMLPLDVSRAADFPAFKTRLTEILVGSFGRNHLDFLVNNAGIGIQAAFSATTETQFDELIGIHLKGPFFLSQTLLSLIADGGRILNVSSGTAHHVVPGYAAYGPIKAAVEALTPYMAKELGERRIRVNVISPGAIASDFSGGAVRDNPQVNKFIASTVALGRVGLPEDVGAAVAAILSDNFGWVNGACIDVTGGQAL
jgi:NAD(P)-dependent dehydrogenase (short-subunit alcohol dehydrogenase family)